MATTEEIERRVEEADAARSARRSAAARRVGELAQRRRTIAEQLSDIEQELGDVLAASSDVIGIDELAKFTDVPAADLNQWLNSRKASRAKRKKSAAGYSSPAKGDTSPASPRAKTQSVGQASTSPKPVDVPAGVGVHVGEVSPVVTSGG